MLKVVTGEAEQGDKGALASPIMFNGSFILRLFFFFFFFFGCPFRSSFEVPLDSLSESLTDMIYGRTIVNP